MQSGKVDPCAEVSAFELLQNLLHFFDGTFDRELPAHKVNDRKQETQQYHICKGQLGCRLQILLCEVDPEVLRQRIQKQQHAAGDHKRHQSKIDHIVMNTAQHAVRLVGVFHLITAL